MQNKIKFIQHYLKRQHSLFLFGAGLLVVVLLGTIHHFITAYKEAHQKKVPVVVLRVSQKTVNFTYNALGTVQPYSIVSIKSLVDGQLLASHFQQGDFVKQGQLLFEIDPKPYQVQLQQANANLAHDEALLNNANALLKRNSKLLNPGYIAKQDYDQSYANLNALKATVAADEAAIAQAELKLSYTKIYAPINGKTGNLNIYPGNIIKNNDSTLVTITQIQPIYISFAIPEKFLMNIADTMKTHNVNVQAQITPVTEQGKLTFINNTIDSTTGTIELKATFSNDSLHLWPGQFINVTLPIQNIANAIIVPADTVKLGQNGYYVYVIDDKHQAHYRSVTLGPLVQEGQVITSGLSAGESVVKDGISWLSENTPVEIVSN